MYKNEKQKGKCIKFRKRKLIFNKKKENNNKTKKTDDEKMENNFVVRILKSVFDFRRDFSRNKSNQAVEIFSY